MGNAAGHELTLTPESSQVVIYHNKSTTQDSQETYQPIEENEEFDDVSKQLNRMDNYFDHFRKHGIGNETSLVIITNLRKAFHNWNNDRLTITDKLADSRFTDQTMNFLRQYKPGDSITIRDACYEGMLHLLWNYTCYSKAFAQAMIKAGSVKHFASKLSKLTDLHDMSEFECFETESALNILQNTIYTYPEGRQSFTEEAVVQKVEPLLRGEEYDEFKEVAILLVAVCITEEEADKLEDTGYISKLIERLENELHGFSYSHDTECLILQLAEGLSLVAMNDNNKKKLVDSGILPIMVEMMKSGNQPRQLVAAKTIWTLCFKDYSKKKVIEEQGCVEALKKLTKSPNKEVATAAYGAMWQLEGEKSHKKDADAKPKDVAAEQHIFVSYSWKQNKDLVRKVADRLQNDGFKIWIDINEMGGSTLDSMAAAIDNAWLCLICASMSYRLSNNCRSEGEYVYTRGIPIVPLMMQYHYKPDGWLGMLMGTKYFINLDTNANFEKAYNDLRKEIARHKQTDAPDGKGQPIIKASTAEQTLAAAPGTSRSSGDHTSRYEAAKWSNKKVRDWINGFAFSSPLNSQLTWLLGTMDGKKLVAFCDVKSEAPDFFYSHLVQKYDANMMEILALKEALEQVP